MLGRMAVAPDGIQEVDGGWPGPFGGNMDSSEAREGATVYLPIFHDGAYFYFGDAHGLQGDGEIAGTGIETVVDATLQFDLIKNQKIAWPRMENQDYIMVAGSARPLEDAFRIANVEMVKWLEHDYGFERWEAMEVLSQLAVSRIANVVDPLYTVMAKFPKKYLPPKN
jgi:acetamidase/formamidase